MGTLLLHLVVPILLGTL